MCAVQLTASIPFNRLIKIGIWNNQNYKYKIATVYSKLQAQYPSKEIYIANCGFFSMSNPWFPVFGLKNNGATLSGDWSQGGWIGMNGNQVTYGKRGTIPDYKWPDAISGYPSLVEEYVRASSFSYIIDNSDRGRTLLGFNPEKIVLTCVADVVGNADFTLDEAVNYMLSCGCKYAINLDGGGSSQCIFNGSKITSSRLVNNFIYMVVEPAPDIAKDLRKKCQTWLNQTYNAGLVVDGSLGPLSLKAIIKGMQKEIGVTVDGSWGPKSKAAYKYIKQNGPNNTTNKIKLIQCALLRKGYWDYEINGIFSDNMVYWVKQFQKASGLDPDGSVGPATINKLFK